MTRLKLGRLAAVLLVGGFVSIPSYSASDLLSEDLLSDEFDDAGDLFADDDLSEGGILARQNKPFHLTLEHSLVLNPQASFQRVNHTTDVRLSSETSIGLIGYAEVELKALQYWQGDTNKPVGSPLSSLAVETLTLQYSLAQVSAKLGRYVLSWGEVEGAGVLDVINPAPSLTSGESGFTPQWLLSGSYYLPAAEVSGFVNLDPSVSEVPGVSLATNRVKEWGVRYGHTGRGSDWALYLGRLVPNSPVLNLATSQGSANAYELLGFSWNKAINDDLLKLDVALKRGLEHNLGHTGLITAKRLDVALAVELNDGDRQWIASLTAKHWLNYQASYLTPAATPVASNKTAWIYTLGVSDSFQNEEYNWSLTHLGTPNGALKTLVGALTWQATDQWQTSLGYATMKAKANTAYVALDGIQRLSLKAKYSY